MTKSFTFLQKRNTEKEKEKETHTHIPQATML